MARHVGDRAEIEGGDHAVAGAILKLRRAQALRDQRRGGAEFVEHIERRRMKSRGARFLGKRRASLEHCDRNATADEIGRRDQADRTGAGDEHAIFNRHRLYTSSPLAPALSARRQKPIMPHARFRLKLSRQRRPRSQRARHRRWRGAPDLRAMVSAHFVAGRRLRRHRAQGRRPPRHRAAKPLGGGDAALGLPVRRHRHHAGELALDRERDRFLSRGCRGQSHRL